MSSPKLAAAAVLAVLVVAACGGSSASATVAPNATAAPAGGSTATPTEAGGQPTAAGGGNTTPAPGGGGGIAAADLCKLFTATELKAATGIPFLAGISVSGTCIWSPDATAGVNVGNQIVASLSGPLATLKATFSGGTDMTVGGRAAYWVPLQGVQSLWIDDGAQTVVLTFEPVPAGGQSDVQKLGDIAASHM